VFFLTRIEQRLKRREALAALHEMRSIIHVIDMHQLTKDPTAMTLSGTASSPPRMLTALETARYLDFCSEMLSLSAKVAVLFVQGFPDPAVGRDSERHRAPCRRSLPEDLAEDHDPRRRGDVKRRGSPPDAPRVLSRATDRWGATMNLDFNRLYLSTEGRIGRAEFWIGLLLLAVVVIVVTLIIMGLFGALSLTSHLLVFIFELAIAYPCYALFAKRFQDRGRPGTYAAIPIGIFLLIALFTLLGLTGTETAPNAFGMVLGFVDLVVAIWILIDLGIMPGTPGPNEFGSAPVVAT
jgi:uncharacterized membrane protein YhaH (DUF805 family)